MGVVGDVAGEVVAATVASSCLLCRRWRRRPILPMVALVTRAVAGCQSHGDLAGLDVGSRRCCSPGAVAAWDVQAGIRCRESQVLAALAGLEVCVVVSA